MIGADRRPEDLPPALAWAGPGLTAFIGAAGRETAGTSAKIGDAGDLAAAFGGGASRELEAAVAAYFGAGGGPCVVLNLPSPESLPPERRAPEWVGEEAGPGYRTGALALLDREDVGTIAAPGLRDPDLRRRLAASLAGREDRFLVLEEVPGEMPFPAADRIAIVPSGAAGAGACGLFLAGLEARDFREDRPEAALEALASGGHPTLGSRYPSAEAWRAWEGLRRSIDGGTRWVIFEPNGPALRRRIERELGGFLDRLHRLGLLAGRAPEEAYRVRCRTSLPGSQPAEGLLSIEVDVNLKGIGSRKAAMGAS